MSWSSTLRRPKPQAAAAPAKFAPDPRRRSMMAKIKIATKELCLEDDDYRAILRRVTGKASSTECSEPQLIAVLDEFKKLGWVPALAKPATDTPSRSKPASHPAANKARALWLSLALLGVIRNRDEAALEAFARRQLGVERMAWADQAKVYKLIEALKAIAERNGWPQDVAGLAEPIRVLKLRLCEAIFRKCKAQGALGPEMSMGQFIRQRLGVDARLDAMTERDLEQLGSLLGKRLADHVADGYYGPDDDEHPPINDGGAAA